MSSRSETTVTINQPLSKLQQAYNTQGYWEFIAENFSPEPGQLHEFEEGKATLFEVLPTTLLPEAVRAMVSQALKVKRVIEYTENTLDYTADVKGTPVDFKGHVDITDNGESVELAYTNDVSVNIPMMGAAIEPKVGEALKELFANEGKLTEQWISDNLD